MTKFLSVASPLIVALFGVVLLVSQPTSVAACGCSPCSSSRSVSAGATYTIIHGGCGSGTVSISDLEVTTTDNSYFDVITCPSNSAGQCLPTVDGTGIQVYTAGTIEGVTCFLSGATSSIMIGQASYISVKLKCRNLAFACPFKYDTAGICRTTSCTPSCSGKTCGSDGCGGTCGSCSSGLTCSSGQCITPTGCAPSCDGKNCGSDGCGGTCGACPSYGTCTAGACKLPDGCYCQCKCCAGFLCDSYVVGYEEVSCGAGPSTCTPESCRLDYPSSCPPENQNGVVIASYTQVNPTTGGSSGPSGGSSSSTTGVAVGVVVAAIAVTGLVAGIVLYRKRRAAKNLSQESNMTTM